MPVDPRALATALCLAALVALLVAEKRGSALGKWLTKPVASLGFLAVAGLRQGDGALGDPLLLAGLTLCLLGDVLLIPKDRRAFLGGIGTFLAGHVVYAFVFARRGLSAEALWLAGPPLLAIALAVLRWLRASLEGEHRRFRGPVLAYVTVISAMVWLALGTWAQARADGLLPGALLFYVSDLFVARNRFVSPGFVNRLVGLPMYYAGQLLLAWTV